MCSNYKSFSSGGTCGCSRKNKKAQRVPQRGPGVAELEKILSDQKHEQMETLYPSGPSMLHQPQPPPFHSLRPMIAQDCGMYSSVPRHPPPPPPFHFQQPHVNNPWCQKNGVNMMRSEFHQANNNFRPDSGLSFTQMMMMGDSHDTNRPDAHPMFQANMNDAYLTSAASHPMSATGLSHFHEDSPSHRFYNKRVPASLYDDKYAMKRSRIDLAMSIRPHQFLSQQQGQSTTVSGKAPMRNEQEKMMLRGLNSAESSRKPNGKSLNGEILTLRPPSPAEQSFANVRPIFIESDSSSESHVSEDQYKYVRPHNSADQSQLFGAKGRGLCMDETRLTLKNNILVKAEEDSLDLNLKL